MSFLRAAIGKRQVTAAPAQAAALLPAVACGRYRAVLERRDFDLLHPEACAPDGSLPFALATAAFRGAF